MFGIQIKIENKIIYFKKTSVGENSKKKREKLV